MKAFVVLALASCAAAANSFTKAYCQMDNTASTGEIIDLFLHSKPA